VCTRPLFLSGSLLMLSQRAAAGGAGKPFRRASPMEMEHSAARCCYSGFVSPSAPKPSSWFRRACHFEGLEPDHLGLRHLERCSRSCVEGDSRTGSCCSASRSSYSLGGLAWYCTAFSAGDCYYERAWAAAKLYRTELSTGVGQSVPSLIGYGGMNCSAGGSSRGVGQT